MVRNKEFEVLASMATLAKVMLTGVITNNDIQLQTTTISYTHLFAGIMVAYMHRLKAEPTHLKIAKALGYKERDIFLRNTLRDLEKMGYVTKSFGTYAPTQKLNKVIYQIRDIQEEYLAGYSPAVFPDLTLYNPEFVELYGKQIKANVTILE